MSGQYLLQLFKWRALITVHTDMLHQQFLIRITVQSDHPRMDSRPVSYTHLDVYKRQSVHLAGPLSHHQHSLDVIEQSRHLSVMILLRCRIRCV